ncbi:SIS domain-containing protein [candidate division KSB1 bacterium]
MSIAKAKEVIQIELESIKALLDRVDDDFQRAIDVIYESKGKVIVCGVGKSGIIGKKIAATLSSTGTPSIYLHPADSLHGDLGIVGKGDIILCLSKSGESEEFRMFISIIRRFDVKIISFTGERESYLARTSDIIIDVSVKEEACPFDLAPTSSTTAMLVMGDALAIALLEKRNFTQEDFAFLHPGGNIGKRFFLKVSEVMYSGDKIPIVKDNASFKEVVVEINVKRFGATCVVDDNESLRGIITDGDLKRMLEKNDNLHSLRAKDIMSENPKTVKAEDLAAAALNKMKQHNIMQLIVADENNVPIGMIHLHDVLKTGLT